MDYGIDSPHRRRERTGLTDVPVVSCDAAPSERLHVRRGPVNHAHHVAPLLQSSDEVLAEKACPSSDEYLQCVAPIRRSDPGRGTAGRARRSRYQAVARPTPSSSDTRGS